MKNPRRLYRQLWAAIWVTRGLAWGLIGVIVLLIILQPSDQALVFQVLFGWLVLAFAALGVKSFIHDKWHKAVQEQNLRTEDFQFLVEAHTDNLIPSREVPPYEGSPLPVDQDRRMITSHLFQHIWKMDAGAVEALPQEERNALISLLKSDDVRIVRRVLELSEQALLLEALPLVRRLVDGKLKASGDLYIDQIAERVLSCLEAHLASEQQQYLRPSAAPNDHLLQPVAYAPVDSQEETLLRSVETQK